MMVKCNAFIEKKYHNNDTGCDKPTRNVINGCNNYHIPINPMALHLFSKLNSQHAILRQNISN